MDWQYQGMNGKLFSYMDPKLFEIISQRYLEIIHFYYFAKLFHREGILSANQ